ncbi:MAG TPA: alcohol dehydrogenase catalytic domain-containing protein [Thermoanaerobaculia bacterium]|nr:alcohol dehydrogenase catalytic domain-containing protein [Thermoanaerobaculia bacterium]
MRAAVCMEGGAVLVESLPRPEPGPGELLLRLRCAGLCGTDLFKLQHATAPSGAVLGHEVVGTVSAIGPGTLGFDLGDRVAVPHHVACGACDLCRRGSEPLCPAFRENLLVPGGFSEWVLVRERAVRRAAFGIPAHVSAETAVFLEPAACVLRGVWRAWQARMAETSPSAAAIVGGGSMGLLHLLVLKAVFPSLRVAVSDLREDRLQRALELGADAAVPPGYSREAVDALSNGLGADVVFDTAGGPEALEAALGAIRPGGTVVLFAHAGEGERAGFDLNAFFKTEGKLIATYSSSLAEQREIHRLMVTGRLDPSPLVTHRLPLSRFDEAVGLARELQAIKVLLVPDEEAS